LDRRFCGEPTGSADFFAFGTLPYTGCNHLRSQVLLRVGRELAVAQRGVSAGREMDFGASEVTRAPGRSSRPRAQGRHCRWRDNDHLLYRSLYLSVALSMLYVINCRASAVLAMGRVNPEGRVGGARRAGGKRAKISRRAERGRGAAGPERHRRAGGSGQPGRRRISAVRDSIVAASREHAAPGGGQ
jgi:predicted RecA/RadA family phage recombinase